MKKKFTYTLIASLLVPGVMIANTSTSNAVFTKTQEQKIQSIASDYIINHPEIIIQSMQKYQQDQQLEAQKLMINSVLQNQDKILNTSTTPQAGNSDSGVAVIEFFDYECVYCHKAAPEIKKLMSNNLDVKFIFQEFPIFSQRFEGSKYGAEAGFAIYNLYGSNAYMKFHEALLLGANSNRDEGKLSKDDINNAIMSAISIIKGSTMSDVENYIESSSPALISDSLGLGATLNIQGTPAFIIMPTEGANSSNIRVLPGYVSYDVLAKNLKDVQNLIHHQS